jgi:uncharacterized protein YjbJ (UPF0337 family)
VRLRTDCCAAAAHSAPQSLTRTDPDRASHPRDTLEYAMNKDQVKGRIKEAKGKVKEVAGRIVGDQTMENKGKLQNAVGKAQAGYGDVKEDIKKAV